MHYTCERYDMCETDCDELETCWNTLVRGMDAYTLYRYITIHCKLACEKCYNW